MGLESILIIIAIIVLISTLVWYLNIKYLHKDKINIEIKGVNSKYIIKTKELNEFFLKANILTKNIKKYNKALKKYELVVIKYGSKEDLEYFKMVRSLFEDLEPLYEDKENETFYEFFTTSKELFRFTKRILDNPDESNDKLNKEND